MNPPGDTGDSDSAAERSAGEAPPRGNAVRKRRRVRKRIVFLEVRTWFPPSPAMKRAIAGFLVFLLVGAGIAYWKRTAIKRFGNEWNAARHLEKAEAALADGELRAAVSRAITSLGLEPDRIETLRVLLEASRAASDSRLLVVGMTVFLHPEATDEDRIAGLSALNDVGDPQRFSALFEQLPEEVRSLPPARYEWLRHLLVRGENRKVDEEIGADPELQDDPRFALLQLDALGGIDGAEADARWHRAALRWLGQGSAPDRDQVWTRIAQRHPRRFPADGASAFLSRLGTLVPGPDVPAILPYNLRIAVDPAGKDRYLQEAVAALRDDDLDDLCLWLMSLREHGVILGFLDEIQAYRSDIAYQTRVRALAESDRLEEALALLQFPPRLVDRMGLLILKASVARRLGNRSHEVAAWQEALLEAGRDMAENRYLNLARFAEKEGELDVAAEALVAACRHPRGIMPPSTEVRWLISYLIERNRPAELLTVTRRLLRAEAENPELLNNAIYLIAVLDDQSFAEEGDPVRVAEMLHRGQPGNDAMRTTLALVYLASGKAEAALALFRTDEREGLGWQRLGDADRAILAMTLLANGLETEAAAAARLVRWPRLLEVERKFYRSKLRPVLPDGEA